MIAVDGQRSECCKTLLHGQENRKRGGSVRNNQHRGRKFWPHDTTQHSTAQYTTTQHPDTHSYPTACRPRGFKQTLDPELQIEQQHCKALPATWDLEQDDEQTLFALRPDHGLHLFGPTSRRLSLCSSFFCCTNTTISLPFITLGGATLEGKFGRKGACLFCFVGLALELDDDFLMGIARLPD